MAQKRLPNFLYEYIEGGAETEWTLRNNRDVFRCYSFLPRVLRDVSQRDVSCKIFGKAASMPVVISPTGFAGFFWPRGDLHLAQAAADFGIPMTQSTVSMTRADRVAATPGLRHWYQLYIWGGPEVHEALIARAIENGSEALVVTVDGPLSGNREWDQRNYRGPDKLSLRSMIDIMRHPQWALGMARERRLPNFENLSDLIGLKNPDIYQVSKWIGAHQNAAMTWADIDRIRKLWPGKLVLKGILRPEEARRAFDGGVDGIVVSNHGGRQMDPSVSPLEMLPEIRKAVGDEATLFVDSGYRRGSDIAMALALGVNAVFVGRATLYGLSSAGAAGVARALQILHSELDRNLALIGETSVANLTLDNLRKSTDAFPPRKRTL
ncbi:MAG: alpha-hydroxy acid oxidase [Paracoccus sp. (in: a-proteobacteria)]